MPVKVKGIKNVLFYMDLGFTDYVLYRLCCCCEEQYNRQHQMDSIEYNYQYGISAYISADGKVFKEFTI